MTLAYAPGETLAHRLDPRSKLAFQAGFAVAAFTWSAGAAPVALSLIVGVVLLVARLSPVAAVADYRLPMLFLAASPVLRGLRPGPPWFELAAAADAAVASYRVVLVFAISTAYVRTTPVVDTQAAIARTVPGRPGRFLSVGTSFVLRFLPLLQADLRRARDASRARLGDQRSLAERMRLVAAGGLRRAFARSDALALALQARCFAWNPTLPPLSLALRDVPVFVVALGLAVTPLV